MPPWSPACAVTITVSLVTPSIASAAFSRGTTHRFHGWPAMRRHLKRKTDIAILDLQAGYHAKRNNITPLRWILNIR
jgi:hypothetical protein